MHTNCITKKSELQKNTKNYFVNWRAFSWSRKQHCTVTLILAQQISFNKTRQWLSISSTLGGSPLSTYFIYLTDSIVNKTSHFFWIVFVKLIGWHLKNHRVLTVDSHRSSMLCWPDEKYEMALRYWIALPPSMGVMGRLLYLSQHIDRWHNKKLLQKPIDQSSLLLSSLLWFPNSSFSYTY